MSTHDYNLANQSGASFRSDLNNCLAAILSNNSNGSAPSTTVAYSIWADTSAGKLKIRNSSNDGFVDLINLDGTIQRDISLTGDLTLTDKIIHSGDTNTAIRFPSADTFTIETAGSERFRVDSSGNCGIKTASPVSNLHVNQGDSDKSICQFTNSTTGTAVGDGFQIGLASDETALLNMKESADMNFKTADTTRMTIQSAGNVGIGTTSPLKLLDVKGAGSATVEQYLRNNTINLISIIDGTTEAQFGTETSHPLVFLTSNTEKMRIDSSGNVGIGTSSASRKLHVSSGTDNVVALFESTDAEAQVRIKDNDSNEGIIGVTAGAFAFENTTTGSLVKIAADGKVGIGTTSPTNNLAVVVSSGDPTILLSGPGHPQIHLQSTSGTDHCGINFGDSDSLTAGRVQYTNSSNHMIINTNGSERLRIDSGGILLVGKTSATAQDLGVEIRQQQIIIGKTASGTVNGIFFAHGSSYVGGLNYSSSATSLVTSSDERLKKNIEDADDASPKIDAIKVRQFDWKSNGKHQEYGFVAQELEPVFAHAVHTGEDDLKTKTVDYASFVPMLVKEIQSLRSRVAALEAA